ncbi:MAG: exosortase C-terminal domain/associated protein EpsI [Pyrinomonadaceae bacterium]
MSETTQHNSFVYLRFAAIAALLAFLYATVLAKLGLDWWTDENYSHGLLVPFVIAMIVWTEWNTVKRVGSRPSVLLGGITIFVAVLLLIAGTLGAELFTQRMSLVLMLVGIVVYFFGVRLLSVLAVPFALLLLAIPIPQIIFNRIAFPLQIWASKMAVWGIRVFDVPTLRKGNVIDILPSGATQTISLEVVEACSGLRSLMTLVTLALVLAYFTRTGGETKFANLSRRDFVRAIVLMISAVPIAVLTNAARVTATGVLTYYYGKQATEGIWHDVSGWVVFVVALALLIGVNFLLRKFQRTDPRTRSNEIRYPHSALRNSPAWPLVATLIFAGFAVNWFANRAEVAVDRRQLTELSTTLGDWRQRGSEIKFGEGVEGVLKTTDYTMREYTNPEGRVANIYVGYYATQRTGATYHSPQNCLPGAGWVLSDPQSVEITTVDGRTFTANRYIIENGIYKEVMIYWYQGRGRIEASEYRDKINTVLDSVKRRRTDAAMVRVMTSVGSDEAASLEAASTLAARLAEQLPPFVPE